MIFHEQHECGYGFPSGHLCLSSFWHSCLKINLTSLLRDLWLLLNVHGKSHSYISYTQCCYIPYIPPILGQLLDLISPTKINFSEPRLELYDPWNMVNCQLWYNTSILKFRIFYCEKNKKYSVFFDSRTQEPEYINEHGSNSKFPSTGQGSRVQL